MRKLKFTLVALALGAVPAFGHGPQIQVTNDNNKITTRNLFGDAPYNVYPAPASSVTNVYVMPLAPLSAFGGTEWLPQPIDKYPVDGSGGSAAGPGLAWTYGWTFDTSAHTTFPAGANLVESLIGNLQKWDGSSFTDTTAAGAQLEIFKSATNFGVSGTASNFRTFPAMVAPTSAADASDLDNHSGGSFILLGDGQVASATHVPEAVADGIYLGQLKLSLANQPATAVASDPGYDPAHPIQDSDSFYFVMYKGNSQSAAVSAANAAFPTGSIQVLPEPAFLGAIGCIVTLLGRRRREVV